VRRLIVLPVVGLALLAGCGAKEKKEKEKEKVVLPPVARTKTCVDGSVRKVGSPRLAFAAVVRSQAAVSRRPGGRAFARFGSVNPNGVQTVFAIRRMQVDAGCKPHAYLVQIPKRPNGITAWVRPSQVAVTRVNTRIVVDLSQKRVTFYVKGKPTVSSKAAIGASATPTPTGSFYVNQRLIPADKTGPFGRGAVGISAFSNVLTGWTQGGPIAIHGTNAPWSIGKAVSNGCIRIPNPALKKLFWRAVSGTPVLIRP
jgi:lipoprotein-anchoring transpeptidase ErfK/SrfK